MKLEVGEFNPKVLLVVGVLAILAGGYLWYGKMYKPAVEAKTAALADRDQSTQTLTADQAKLQEAQQRDKQASENDGDDRLALAEIQITRLAIPHTDATVSGLQQINAMATRAGIEITDDSVNNEDNGGQDGTLQTGPKHQSITVVGHGTYDELSLFLRDVQATATVYNGKLYVRTRLMAVTSLTIDDGKGDNGTASAADGGDSSTSASGEQVLPKGHIHFTVVIEFYSDQATAGAGAGAGAGAAATTAPAATDTSATSNGTTNGTNTTNGTSTPSTTTPAPGGDTGSSTAGTQTQTNPAGAS